MRKNNKWGYDCDQCEKKGMTSRGLTLHKLYVHKHKKGPVELNGAVRGIVSVSFEDQPLPPLTLLHIDLCGKARHILRQKSHDYTNSNIDPFSNFRAAEKRGVKMETGLLLRVDDKLARIQTFIDKGTLLVQDESVEDAILDIINYMVLLKGMIDEKKNNGGGSSGEVGG